MKNNGDKDGVIELGGYEFRRVKNGLDEAQVVSFVKKLISQRDTLIQREEHLSALTKLAEKTVTEADKLAEELKTEATNQAKAEAATIIAEAEEKAQHIIEQKRTEANEQAAAIMAEAERNAELLLENERKKIQPELSKFADQLYSQLLSELERFKQQLLALPQVKFEHALSQPAEQTSTIAMEADEIPDEFQKLIRPIDQKDTSEPDWELEILPPMDIVKIMQIVTYLDGLPEVENTEIIPEMDKPSIVVFVREPIHLVDMLTTLPVVAEVKEDATDVAGADGKPRKVQIVLSGKTVPQEGN